MQRKSTEAHAGSADVPASLSIQTISEGRKRATKHPHASFTSRTSFEAAGALSLSLQ
jgi:hypothetical protein